MKAIQLMPWQAKGMRAAFWVLLTWALPLLAWGPKGHLVVAEASLQSLPRPLRTWCSGLEPMFIQASLEPDLWKAENPSEAWKHRIACERYGGPNKVPHQASAARALVGAWAFEQGGQLPWVIADRHRLLVEAFKSGDRSRVVHEAGWLCHYVADAHVPLHTTENRNGKSTGQKGVQKRWETDLVSLGVTKLPHPSAAVPPADLPTAIASWIQESHAMVQSLLEADRTAGREAKGQLEVHTAVLWLHQKDDLLQQLCRSADRSGALILSAWIQAGRPRP